MYVLKDETGQLLLVTNKTVLVTALKVFCQEVTVSNFFGKTNRESPEH